MPRRLVVSAAVLAVAVTTFVIVVGSAPARAAYPVSRIGFRIPADGTASGAWLGSRTLGSRPVYLIDPARKLVRTRYAAARPVAKLGSRRATARAAWILSRYGNQHGADRRYYAAATDVALDALLVGGAYSLTGSATRRHLRQSGHGATVRSWARYFLTVSRKYAGPYRVTISRTGATVGGPVTVRARITAAATGAPIPQRPVRIRYDGREPVRLGTDDDGRVKARFTSTRPGDVPVTLRIGALPASTMFVRAPSNRRASRAAVAGIRVAETRRFTVPVRGTPAIEVRPPATMSGPGLTSGSFTLDGVGGSAANTATATLYGPFDSLSQAVCVELEARASAGVTVGGNGTYPLPSLRVPRYGIYVWKVRTAANRLNHEAERCGGKVRALSRPTLTVRAPVTRVPAGRLVRASVKPTGLPDGYQRTGRVRLIGPFLRRDRVHCSAGRTLVTRRFTAEANVAHWTPRIKVTRKGYYAWVATAPSSYFSFPAASRCRARGSVFVVR
ncbi:hypothetical protein EKO23_23340 [Nocardioides guangzhouensis]|uniref:Big-1 domain-containing protein n=1 Tax=Nocardioides guangzhouensis TaxID=2497878 RepID=A0A4Q4Z3P2_9ACTN|nr:hypothetical protein [Nocardioides guangzhouensis]RYP81576.1 hypothetical protein EKO23_23340 [Nocardioides guangzhouensis]